MTDPAATTVRDRLRAALRDAMRQRDRAYAGVLRATLGAIDNAEAVDADAHGLQIDPDAEFAGAVSGLGGAEVARRHLDEADVAEIVRAEVAELRASAEVYAEAGRPEHAALLARHADALGALLDRA